MTRVVVVQIPDWPLHAAGVAGVASAVLHANRVVACSAAARAHGVRTGMRRREAQARCPDLVLVPHDPPRDVRAFEPVLRALEGICPLVEVVRPGTAAFAACGPARYFGGEEALVEKVAEEVTLCSGHRCQVGVADGLFAAELAAREGKVVPPGSSAAFLAPFGVEVLGRPELASILRRLGVRTLGDFAALPRSAVLSRFGEDAAEAHRLACGTDHRPLAARAPPPDLVVHTSFDPPVDRVDRVAFAAKALADELARRLSREALSCTRIRIEVETSRGETLARRWRHDTGLTRQEVADRVRWQLDGWLADGRWLAGGGWLAGGWLAGGWLAGGWPAGPGPPPGGGTPTPDDPPGGGIVVLRIVPEEVGPARGRQRGFWGSETEASERAARALARVQGLLGPDAVCTAVFGGGRSFAEQATAVPWGSERVPARPGLPAAAATASGRHRAEQPPWPGRIPGPAPATVYPDPPPVQVDGGNGRPVAVTGRGLLTAPPARVTVAGRARVVRAWAGPWPCDERWWDPAAHRRRARLQVLLDDGSAHLLSCEGGSWWLEATYD